MRIKLTSDQQKEIDKLVTKFTLYNTQKDLLINKSTDFALLEQFIQRCNDNPKLCVDIKLTDGTVITLKTTPEKKAYTDHINGDYNDYMEIN